MNCWVRLLVLIILTLIPTATLSAVPKDKKQDPEQIGNREVGKGVNFYSLEREISLGKQLAQEIERQARVVDDPVAAEFVNRLAQNLAHNSDIQVPVTARLIDSSEVNAFALPGGFLFVNTGLVLKSDSEAELAGVMAHEIAPSQPVMAPARLREVSSWTLPACLLYSWEDGRVTPSAKAPE